jgi:hypothetical protein
MNEAEGNLATGTRYALREFAGAFGDLGTPMRCR